MSNLTRSSHIWLAVSALQVATLELELLELELLDLELKGTWTKRPAP